MSLAPTVHYCLAASVPFNPVASVLAFRVSQKMSQRDRLRSQPQFRGERFSAWGCLDVSFEFVWRNSKSWHAHCLITIAIKENDVDGDT